MENQSVVRFLDSSDQTVENHMLNLNSLRKEIHMKPIFKQIYNSLKTKERNIPQCCSTTLKYANKMAMEKQVRKFLAIVSMQRVDVVLITDQYS